MQHVNRHLKDELSAFCGGGVPGKGAKEQLQCAESKAGTEETCVVVVAKFTRCNKASKYSEHSSSQQPDPAELGFNQKRRYRTEPSGARHGFSHVQDLQPEP